MTCLPHGYPLCHYSQCGNVCHHELHFTAGFEAVSLMCPGYSHNITPFLVKEWLERFYLLSFNVANVDTGAALASYSSILLRIGDMSLVTSDMPPHSSLDCATNAINYSLPM